MNTKHKILCSAILFYASQAGASELFTLQSSAFADNA